jgi:hypothetical protein
MVCDEPQVNHGAVTKSAGRPPEAPFGRDRAPTCRQLIGERMLGAVSSADTLENGGEPHPGLRWVAYAGCLLLVGAIAFVSVHRAADRREARASFDRMLTLAAGAQAAVERGVSQERDTAQNAEPLLNSSHTASEARQQLYITVSTSARQAQADVDAQLQQLQADRTGRTGRLRVARDATLAYLSDWSDLFARAAGASGQYAGPQEDLNAARLAAQTALEKAAPDHARALKASTVFGTISN